MGGIGIQGALSQGLADVARSIVLVSSTERQTSDVAMSPRAATAFIRWTGHETQGRMMMRGGFGKQVHVDDLDELRSSWAAMDPQSFVFAMDGLKNFDFSDDLTKCELNAHVVCGDRDLVTPIARSRHIHELLPNSRLRELPGIGHMSILEAPDVVAEQIVAAATSS